MRNEIAFAVMFIAVKNKYIQSNRNNVKCQKITLQTLMMKKSVIFKTRTESIGKYLVYQELEISIARNIIDRCYKSNIRRERLPNMVYDLTFPQVYILVDPWN